MIDDLEHINQLRTSHGMAPFASLTEASNHSRKLRDEHAQRTAARSPTPSAAVAAPAAAPMLRADQESAKTAEQLLDALDPEARRSVLDSVARSLATAEADRATTEAAESIARAERAAIVEEAAAIADGPPTANPDIVVADNARRYGIFVFRMLGERLTAPQCVAHVTGRDYLDDAAFAFAARLRKATALEAGVPITDAAAVDAEMRARAAHEPHRLRILELVASHPSLEPLIVEIAANTETTFTMAYERVQRAARRELVVATATTLRATDAARAAADLTHAKDDAAKARQYIAEQARLGVTVSAAEAVAHVTAPETN